MTDETNSDQPGFEIAGRLYPVPQGFRLGDPALVREVTGMSFADFAEALDDERSRRDPVIQLGIIAVAVWQQHPTWRRERVARYVEALEISGLRFVGGGADAIPPAASTAQATNSDASSLSASASPAATSAAPSPHSSGDPGLDTGSP